MPLLGGVFGKVVAHPVQHPQPLQNGFLNVTVGSQSLHQRVVSTESIGQGPGVLQNLRGGFLALVQVAAAQVKLCAERVQSQRQFVFLGPQLFLVEQLQTLFDVAGRRQKIAPPFGFGGRLDVELDEVQTV